MRLRRSLVLLGMMGSGKTTVARLLAAKAGCALHQLDVLIVAAAGKEIPAVFADDGEERFRELEAAALADALAGEVGVIDTGGGIAEAAANRAALLASDTDRCYLATPVSVLCGRVGTGEGRPMLANVDVGERISDLSRVRDANYRAVASLVMPSKPGFAPQDAAARIMWELG